MMYLIIGGSGSGKSMRAENLIEQLWTGSEDKKIYWATMIAYGDEGKQRVLRHKNLRKGKGFETIECPLLPAHWNLSERDLVLVEDIPNLVANEMFEKAGRHDTCVERITEGLLHLKKRVKHLVVVTGNVSEEVTLFEGEMKQYLANLNACNRYLAQLADQVEEVVCGIPIPWKEYGGKGQEEKQLEDCK